MWLSPNRQGPPMQPLWGWADSPWLQVVLVTLPGCDVEGIQAEVRRQTEALPRGSTVQQALANSAVILARDAREAAAISNT